MDLVGRTKPLNIPLDPEERILVTKDGSVATVTINRPERHNAIDYRMWQHLIDAVSLIRKDSSITTVVFRGGGQQAFSSGADIKDFPLNRFNSTTAKTYAYALEGALDAIEQLEIPTIAMIRGICVGGGLELATATDIRIASHSSTFGVPVARIGIVAGFKEMSRIVRLVGFGNASHIAISGDLFDANEAFRIGLITRLTKPDALERKTYEFANQIASLAPFSHATHKEILQVINVNPALEDLDEQLINRQFQIFDTADFKEGLDAFHEKRKPKFRGI